MKRLLLLILLSLSLKAEYTYEFDCVLNNYEIETSSDSYFTKACFRHPKGITLVFNQFSGEIAFESKRYKVMAQKIDDTHFLVEDVQPFHIKLKAKHKKGTIYVKALFKSEMFKQSLVRYNRDRKDFYITKIEAKVDEIPCFEMQTSAYMSKNPIVKFKVLAKGSEEVLKITSTDNFNLRESKEVYIKSTTLETAVYKPSEVKRANVTHYKNTDKTVEKIYGNIELIHNKVELITPQISSNSGAIPASVRSALRAKGVTLFLKEGNALEYVVVAKWNLFENSLVYFDLKVHSYENIVKLLAVVQADDGKYYYDEKDVIVAIGGEEG